MSASKLLTEKGSKTASAGDKKAPDGTSGRLCIQPLCCVAGNYKNNEAGKTVCWPVCQEKGKVKKSKNVQLSFLSFLIILPHRLRKMLDHSRKLCN